jgi:hypothetical protein
MNRRAKLSVVAPNATPEEAAAVIAAVERFMRATAPTLVAPPAAVDRWQQAALHEGIARQPQPPLPWL